MFRVQTILPYFILLVVCVSVLAVLSYSSRPPTDKNVVPEYTRNDFNPYKNIPLTSDGNRLSDELFNSKKKGETDEVSKESQDNPNVDMHFMKEIQVGENNFYKPLNLYSTAQEEEKFTILIQTFNRTDLLKRLLNHYSAVHGVDRIVIVWNTLGEVPPYDWWEELKPHPTEVIFLEQSKNKIRNRLQRFPEIRTEGVLMLDDDHLYASKDVEFAFRVWKQHRNKLVGFVARKHVEVSDGIYIYGDFDLDSGTPLGGYVYSFILTGAAFTHRDYLEMFNSDEVPYGVHELIDRKENCEDLAFNFMVGRYLAKNSKQTTQECVGLYVHPTVTKNLEKDAISGYTGKWKNPEHFAVRSHCINALAKLYSGVPMPYCDMVLVSYFDFSRLKQC